MLRSRNLLLGGALGLGCAALVAAAAAPAAPATPAYVTAAVGNPARIPRLMKLDADRKPAELMTFAGIKPGDKVAELVPEAGYDGYYTQVISKIVGTQGKVYPYVPLRGFRDIETKRVEAMKQQQAGKTAAPDSLELLLALQHTTDYKNLMAIEAAVGSVDGDCQSPKMNGNNCFGLPEQVDAVFTGSGYHELHNTSAGTMYSEPVDMVVLNKAIFREMKPGGVYVVMDNTAASGAGFTQTVALKRAEAEAVKKEVVAAGFTFEAASDVLANAADDLSKPAAGDKASRFVMRFRKPASASRETKRYPQSIMSQYFGNTYSGSGSRADMYHADGAYQEFGVNDMQIMHTYFDADGHNCLYHEYPPEQEGFVICHFFEQDRINAKVGDSWKRADGRGVSSLKKGYVYPTAPPAGQQQQPAAPAGGR